MRFTIMLVALCAGLTSTQVTAKPVPFEFKPDIKNSASERYLRVVYEIVPNPSGQAAKARLAILKAMVQMRRVSWQIEEEGEGYIIGRYDYRGHTIFNRVEYDDQNIQIKYAGGLKAFSCELLIDDFCYKTHRHYYSYSKDLRNLIIQNL